MKITKSTTLNLASCQKKSLQVNSIAASQEVRDHPKLKARIPFY
jgi:hypothetical protein